MITASSPAPVVASGDIAAAAEVAAAVVSPAAAVSPAAVVAPSTVVASVGVVPPLQVCIKLTAVSSADLQSLKDDKQSFLSANISSLAFLALQPSCLVSVTKSAAS